MTIIDKKTGQSGKFIILEKTELIWKLISLDKRQESYLKCEDLNSKDLLYSIVQRQILRLWDTGQFKPKQFLANKFDRVNILDDSRLIFFSETVSGERQLIDNGKFWMFPEYGQPFIFCGYLACPVELDSGYWTIAVERIRHYKFTANHVPTNIRVDNKTHLMSLRHPDNVSSWVTIPLADYGLKPVE
ncbi:MAG: hypothetical protein Q8P20_09265 [bacterium]|nr:hypothetical protein [bacterium]